MTTSDRIGYRIRRGEESRFSSVSSLRISDCPAFMPKTDYSHHVSKHRSAGMRLVFVGLGSLCVLLAVVGLFVPLLPSTPFILLAAACYARASRRFYNWLLNTRAFGPAILEWRLHRSIPFRVKVIAIAMMAVTLSISVLVFVKERWLQLALGLFGVLLALWLYRIPSRDAPGRSRR
jgi:uncharacterized membrane protein YbaN (DUF454 family)